MSRAKRPRQNDTRASSRNTTRATRPVANAESPSKKTSTTDPAADRSQAPTTVVRVPRIVVVGAGLLLLLGLGAFLLGTRQSETGGSNDVGQLSPLSTLQASDFHSLAVSPQDADRVWFGSHAGIQESTDGGRSWHPLAGGMNGDAMSMALPATDPLTVYIAGHNIFKRSGDGGKTWQDVQTDLPSTDIHGFAVDPTDARHVYALVAQSGLVESADGGDRWQAVLAQPPGAFGALAVVSGNPPGLYAATRLGLMRSQDGAKTWHRKDVGLPAEEASVRAIVPVPNQPQELYAATLNGLYHTTNEGATWARVALAGQDLYSLAASQTRPLRLYALSSTGAVYRLEAADLGTDN